MAFLASCLNLVSYTVVAFAVAHIHIVAPSVFLIDRILAETVYQSNPCLGRYGERHNLPFARLCAFVAVVHQSELLHICSNQTYADAEVKVERVARLKHVHWIHRAVYNTARNKLALSAFAVYKKRVVASRCVHSAIIGGVRMLYNCSTARKQPVYKACVLSNFASVYLACAPIVAKLESYFRHIIK